MELPDEGRTHYALRGAAAFGLTVLAVFALSAWYADANGESRSTYLLAGLPLCGIAVGLAYGRRLVLPLVLACSFLAAGSMFMLQEERSNTISSVVFMGCASAFLFWIIGECATLALPAEWRGAGAKAFAIPGGVAGMAFQFLYGPGSSLLELGQRPWWRDDATAHLVLWLIAGVGGSWLFGAELDHFYRFKGSTGHIRNRSRWAVASVVAGVLGIGISAAYFVRFEIPLDLSSGLSPAAAASDWLASWAVLAGVMAMVALMQALLRAISRTPRPHGWGWSGVGIGLAAALLFTSLRITANPWKAQFNRNYAEKLLRQSGQESPAYSSVIYRGNLVLAQASLDNNDVAGAGQYLIAAAETTGFPGLEQAGPDTSVARVLLQRGQKEPVLQYLDRFHKLWPAGEAVLARWETAIRAGRTPNFNNRSTDGTQPEIGRRGTN